MASSISLDRIIVMGLPKTGTTATATALVDVGYHVAHNQGDKLSPQCQVLANTHESSYAELDRKHPSAKWLIIQCQCFAVVGFCGSTH